MFYIKLQEAGEIRKAQGRLKAGGQLTRLLTFLDVCWMLQVNTQVVTGQPQTGPLQPTCACTFSTVACNQPKGSDYFFLTDGAPGIKLPRLHLISTPTPYL